MTSSSGEDCLNSINEGMPTKSEHSQTNLFVFGLKKAAAARRLIGLCVLICVVLALITLKTARPVYKVEALLLANTEQAGTLRSTGTSSTLSQVLGGGAAPIPEIDEFQALLGSPEVAARLEKKYNLLHDIFEDNWDARAGRWREPDWKDRIHFQIVTALGGVQHQDLNYYDLAKFLGSNVLFQRPTTSPVMSMSLSTTRPKDGQRWLGIIIYEVSDIIRSQMIQERQNYVNYLLQQLSQSSLTSSRDATISILADQYRSLMVLNSAKTFPLIQLQPPTPSQFPVNKSVSIYTLIGILAGLMIAGVLMACGISDVDLNNFFSRLRATSSSVTKKKRTV
jgi:hypothetical protein